MMLHNKSCLQPQPASAVASYSQSVQNAVVHSPPGYSSDFLRKSPDSSSYSLLLLKRRLAGSYLTFSFNPILTSNKRFQRSCISVATGRNVLNATEMEKVGEIILSRGGGSPGKAGGEKARGMSRFLSKRHFFSTFITQTV